MSDDCVIVEDKCYFCGNEETVLFNEHFFFCPSCTAIYTFMIVHEGCEHIQNAPVIYRHPWCELEEDKPFIYTVTLDDQAPYRCSECDEVVVADGW